MIPLLRTLEIESWIRNFRDRSHRSRQQARISTEKIFEERG